MRHEQVLDNLSGYLEGGLDPAMQSAVEHHLRGCAECYTEMTTLRGVYQMLEAPAAFVEPPARFHDDVMRKVRLSQQKAPRAGFLGRWNWGWAGAAFAATAVAVALLFPAMNPPQGGSTAGPQIQQFFPNRTPVGQTTPVVVLGSTEPAMVGREYGVSMEFTVKESGTWRVSVVTSPGLSLVNESGLRWGGRDVAVKAGERFEMPLRFLPTRRDSVQEVAVRITNLRSEVESGTVLFVPVQTNGSADMLVDWNEVPGATARTTMHELARVYGVTAALPESLMDQPLSLSLRGATAVTAVQGVAGSLDLQGSRNGNTYNLFR